MAQLISDLEQQRQPPSSTPCIFKHVVTGEKREYSLNFNESLHDLILAVTEPIRSDFNLENFELVYADEHENGPAILPNKNIILKNVFSIEHAAFYIRPVVHPSPTTGQCPVCYQNFTEELPRHYQCEHGLCTSCFDEWSRRATTCPLCRQPRNSIPEHIEYRPGEHMYDWNANTWLTNITHSEYNIAFTDILPYHPPTNLQMLANVAMNYIENSTGGELPINN